MISNENGNTNGNSNDINESTLINLALIICLTLIILVCLCIIAYNTFNYWKNSNKRSNQDTITMPNEIRLSNFSKSNSARTSVFGNNSPIMTPIAMQAAADNNAPNEFGVVHVCSFFFCLCFFV